MSNMIIEAFKAGSARMIKKEFTNFIHTNSGNWRIVKPGARRVRIVAMRFIDGGDRPDAQHQQRENPVIDSVVGRKRRLAQRRIAEPTDRRRAARDEAEVQ